MIKTRREQNSVIIKHPNSGYYIPKDSELIIICDDCTMSLSMSCYAATKHHYPEKDSKVARVQTKEKKNSAERPNKYGEMETSVSLDKYNGKLMNSIWGLYNRNSPHNFKKNYADEVAMPKEQVMMKSDKMGSSFVQFTIPQFNGIVFGAIEAKYEINKPKTSLEKMENLFTSPIF